MHIGTVSIFMNTRKNWRGVNKNREHIEGENQKGISDISPTLQESQNKNFTIV